MMARMDPVAQRWLEKFLAAHGAVAGTVHRHADGVLLIAAAVNIPEPVLRATERIPRGKGMGGLALERDRAVSTCNLQDAGGDVRPGARAVGAGAAVAFPVHDAAGATRAVVGVAFAEARTLDDDEIARLGAAAADLPI
jgi:hypothetical protein